MAGKKPKLPKGEWVEISGDDWSEQELQDGTTFEHAVEIRSYDAAGAYRSHYYAILED